MRPTIVRVTLIVVLAVAVAGVNVAVAFALDNIVPTSNYDYACSSGTQANPPAVCLTDNSNLAWWMEGNIDYTTSNIDTGVEWAVNQTMGDSYQYSDLNPFYDSSPIFSGPGETDIIYRSKASDFGSTNFVGYTWCDDDETGSTYRCDQQYVNFKAITAGQALACHETGHGVGLLHGQNSSPITSNGSSTLACMINPLNTSQVGLGASNFANIDSVD